MGEEDSVLYYLLNSPDRSKGTTAKTIYGQKPPAGSKQRPSSANPKVRMSSDSSSAPGKAKGNASSARNEEWDFLLSFAREDLASAIVELKKEYRSLQGVTAQLKAENQRTENELLKQQRRIDKLVSPHVNGQSVLDIRREIEKSILVRQLKGHINILRETIVEKDRTIDKLKTSQKGSNLMEITAEKEEYFIEIGRLKAMLQIKTDEMEAEKKRVAGTARAMENETEGELRREIERLSFGYQELLTRLTGSANGQGPPVAMMNAPAPRPTYASTPTHQSPPRLSPKKAAVVPKSPVPSSEPPSVRLASLKGGAQQFEEDTDIRTSANALSGTPGAVESSIEGGGFGLDAGEGIELGGAGQGDAMFDDELLADVGGDEVELTALPGSPAAPISHIVPVGTVVKSRFRGGESFYQGKVKVHNPDGSYWITYDDGDEEHSVLEINLRNLNNQPYLAKGLKHDASRQSTEYADDFER